MNSAQPNDAVVVSSEITGLFATRADEFVWDMGFELIGGLRPALLNMCESEIERRLLVELLFANWEWVVADEIEIHDHRRGIEIDDAAFVTLAPQFPVGKYRVDIAVFGRVTRDRMIKVAVECDGHKFHEKTKEQAARDK